MEILLIRYAEIGLKTSRVRSRFENRMKDNLIQMFAADGVEALVEKGEARFYVTASDLDAAIASARKVFGVASISVAETCEPDMESICACAAEYSRSRMVKGKSYAVKARRAGNQNFTSMEVGRSVGDAIWNANLDKDPKVDLTNPDILFYVEVRPRQAYIFQSYIECHAGLPLGTQGRVLAYVDDDRGILSAWLMMKRGCRVYVRGSADVSVLKAYDPFLKVLSEDDKAYKNLGYVFGLSVDDIPGFDQSAYDLPVFFPTVGMTDEEVAEKMAEIRSEAGIS
jgi:thiamine biosynthesis protein ThiI